MNLEKRVAYLESLLRRTQEFVGERTQAESQTVSIDSPPTSWLTVQPMSGLPPIPWPTRSELLRKEAEDLDRRDALIVELREALRLKDEALKQSTAVP